MIQNTTTAERTRESVSGDVGRCSTDPLEPRSKGAPDVNTRNDHKRLVTMPADWKDCLEDLAAYLNEKDGVKSHSVNGIIKRLIARELKRQGYEISEPLGKGKWDREIEVRD